jgi:eukaryotic-like serine/threonine-protein kinase
LLFIGSCAGIFYALDKTSGEVRWSYNIRKDRDQNNFHGNPLITDELVITTTDGGSRPTGVGGIYAFEKATGKVRWTFDGGRGVPTGILRLDNRIYAATFNDELVCLDLQTGRLNWSFRTGRPNSQLYSNVTPAGERDRVYFGGLDGKVYAFDSATGKKVWERDLSTPIAGSMILSGDSLYVGTLGKTIYRVRAKNGEVMSDYVATDQVYWSFALANDSLISHVGDKGLISLPMSLDKPRWTQESAKPWSSSQPYLWQGTAIVGTEDGEVDAFRLSDGLRQWSHKFTGPIGGIGGDQNVLYIGTRNGMLYAYQPR